MVCFGTYSGRASTQRPLDLSTWTIPLDHPLAIDPRFAQPIGRQVRSNSHSNKYTN
jgi:hypothetical protein